MDIYHLHPVTREYVGPGAADPDPMEEDNWLIPAHAVTIKPPKVTKGQVAVWSEEGCWSKVEDHRGETWYQPDGLPVTITELGEPEGLTNEAPPPPPPFPDTESALTAMTNWINQFTVKLSGFVPLQEQSAWAAKEMAARGHLDGTATPSQTQMLQLEADQTGESLSDLSAKIIEKAELWSKVIGSVSGLRRKTEAEVAAATTSEEREAILTSARGQAEALAASLGIV